MKEERENELVKRIKKIEKKLAKIERESRVGLEDQLFFGLVVSVALFVVTLNVADMTYLFHNILMVDYNLAVALSESIKNISIVFLISSAILRYYGAVKPHKGARLWSFLCLLASFDFFLLFLLPRLTLNEVLVRVRFWAFPLSHVLLFFIYLFMGKFIERRMISFYAKRGFVLKRYSKPLVSFLFAVISVSLYSSLILQAFLYVYFGITLVGIQYDILFYSIYAILTTSIYLLFLRRQKILRFITRMHIRCWGFGIWSLKLRLSGLLNGPTT